MLTLKQIREALQDRRVSVVANETGIHVNTVIHIRDNEDANPTYRVLSGLSRYLEKRGVGAQ